MPDANDAMRALLTAAVAIPAVPSGPDDLSRRTGAAVFLCGGRVVDDAIGGGRHGFAIDAALLSLIVGWAHFESSAAAFGRPEYPPHVVEAVASGWTPSVDPTSSSGLSGDALRAYRATVAQTFDREDRLAPEQGRTGFSMLRAYGGSEVALPYGHLPLAGALSIFGDLCLRDWPAACEHVVVTRATPA